MDGLYLRFKRRVVQMGRLFEIAIIAEASLQNMMGMGISFSVRVPKNRRFIKIENRSAPFCITRKESSHGCSPLFLVNDFFDGVGRKVVGFG